MRPQPETSRGESPSVRYDPSREDEVKALVERVADLIALGPSFAPATTHCPACDFRKLCPHSTAKTDTISP